MSAQPEFPVPEPEPGSEPGSELPTLDAQVAIVTGASRGLGRLIAHELARAGAAVVVAARTTEPGRMPGTIHQTVAEIEARGGRARAVRCDVTDDDALAALVAETIDAFGRVDVLVNNAGLVTATPFLQTEPKRLDLLWRVNVRAPFVLMRHAVTHMIERGRGHVINIGTQSSQRTGTEVPLGYAGYTATKAALVRMSLACALELREHGVAVNALAPTGLVETEGWAIVGGGQRLPIPEPGEYVARAATWIAAQDPRRYSGRFVDSQAVLVEAGLLERARLSWADLPKVDVAAWS